MVPEHRFHDGHAIPALGFGTSRVRQAETVAEALRAGYRLIDTAAFYGNERAVGEAVRESGIDRAEIFITSKVWPDHFGRDATAKSFEHSLKLLGMERMELFLLHWPGDSARARLEAWRLLVELQKEGRARSIGVSNHSPEQIDALMEATGVMPVINQVELHPLKQRRRLREFHAAHKIVTESWAPLGHGKLFRNRTIMEIAGALGRTPAQIVLRWHLEHGLLPIPKSNDPTHMRENFDMFGFSLTPEQLAMIDALDAG
jgi:2,5-diketo-D-gluconate reductase A